MDGHHFIFGEVEDFITGERLKDTHDERYRQKLARLLVEKKGYLKTDLKVRQELKIRAGENCALVWVDIVVLLSEKDEKARMIIKYAPGSLVTRQRSVLAASRLVMPDQIPIAVVTNGEDAQILDGVSGKVIAEGLDAIPSKNELMAQSKNVGFEKISAKRAEKEQRIIYAFEINDACPCDNTVCRL